MGTVFVSTNIITTIDLSYFTGVINTGFHIRGCRKLLELILPPNLTAVTVSNAFRSNSSMNVCVIPSRVGSLPADAVFYGCKQNKAFIFLPGNPPSIGSSTFNETTGKIYVPDDSYTLYHNSSYWSAKTLFTFSQLAIDYPDYYEKFITPLL